MLGNWRSDITRGLTIRNINATTFIMFVNEVGKYTCENELQEIFTVSVYYSYKVTGTA